MSTAIIALVGLLGAFLLGGVWVGLAMVGTGAALLEIFRDLPIQKLLSLVTWNTATSPELLALPLFVLMAEVLFRTTVGENLFRGLAPWTSGLPGGLMHVNILGCTIFAAVSGSSAATTQTVGRTTVPELIERGYDRGLIVGSLAGAGTLGLLIPPSLIMIVYGVMAEVSILKLFIAGVVPGVLLAALFTGCTAILSVRRPAATTKHERVDWSARFNGAVQLGPLVFLITLIIGSLYGGIATPTEAAAMGVIGALMIAAGQRSLSWRNVREALVASVSTVSMMGLILIGAQFLTVALGFLGIPRHIANGIAMMELGPIGLIAVLMFVYVALGCILDGMSTIVMTLPITLPLITAAGYDPIWFGVFLVVVIEMAQITPPIGFNLFVIQNLTGDSLGFIARQSLPYFLMMVVLVVILVSVPDVALWLPGAGQ